MSVRENTDKNLKFLNLSFGVIIIILSIFTFLSFMIDNIKQIMIISIVLLTSGMTFLAIGIPDNIQKAKARKISSVVGSIISIIGLTIFFISLLVITLGQFIINTLLLIFIIIIGIIGVTVPALNLIERNEIKKNARRVMYFFGLLIIGFSIVNGMGLLIGLWPSEVIVIFISITLLFHGISRALLYITGVYK